jgi:hypothetical protein
VSPRKIPVAPPSKHLSQHIPRSGSCGLGLVRCSGVLVAGVGVVHPEPVVRESGLSKVGRGEPDHLLSHLSRVIDPAEQSIIRPSPRASVSRYRISTIWPAEYILLIQMPFSSIDCLSGHNIHDKSGKLVDTVLYILTFQRPGPYWAGFHGQASHSRSQIKVITSCRR